MNRSARRALITLVVFLSIPVVYNACGPIGKSATSGGSATSNSFNTACTASRRQSTDPLESSLRRTLPTAAPEPTPSVFAGRKVQLGQVESAASGGATATGRAGARSLGTLRYDGGTKLGVIVDGSCLRANRESLADTLISRDLLDDPTLDPMSTDQALEWTLPAPLTAEQISVAADAEACVIGVGFDHEYQTSAVTFNDPQRGLQTYLAAEQADAAYNLAFGSPGLPTSGANVVVAVLDSGVEYTHPDLIGKMVPAIGKDVADGYATPNDVSAKGHGTHVAGMIAAAANNGVGISGVMPYRAQILAVKIISSATAATTSRFVYNGVNYAITQGASVINLSIAAVSTGAASDALLQQAMINAVNAGITVVTVVGNSNLSSGLGYLVDGVNTSVMPGHFATMNGVIGVGSINAQDGQKSAFSMFGTTYAEIGAVGAESDASGVVSTLPVNLGGFGGYGRLQGTSQAAPQVAAAAALAVAMIQSSYAAKPSAAEIESLIMDSADQRTELAPYFRQGNRLNLLRLVQLVRSRYPLTATGATRGC